MDSTQDAAHQVKSVALLEQKHLTSPSQLVQIQAPAGETPAYCKSFEQPVFSAMAKSLSVPSLFAHLPISYEWAHLSLEDECARPSVLVPEWITFEYETGKLSVNLASDDTRRAITEYTSKTKRATSLLPSVRLNASGSSEQFLELLVEKNSKAATVASLIEMLASIKAQGACLDFNTLKLNDMERIAPFWSEITGQFRTSGLLSCIVLNHEQAFQQPALLENFDQVVVKMFQTPWIGSAPMPLASDQWFEDTVRQSIQEIGTERLVVAIGNFAVDWTSGTAMPKKLPYSEAMQRISFAKAEVHFSPNTSNSFSRFTDSEGVLHKIWMLDAASAHNQLAMLRKLGIENVAVWSLGQEDPGLWKVLAGQLENKDSLSARLSMVDLQNYVSYTGEGAFLRVEAEPDVGFRQTSFDLVSGRLIDQSYSTIPSPYTVERYGKPEATKLVLTFDDGPHPEYTKQILDILRDTKTPGSFFVLGQSVMNAPDLLNRIVDEGHEIGAHSFSHPRMDQISDTRLELEFSLLDKIVAGVSGRGSLLYREPFLRSGGPISAARVASLMEAQKRGYIISGMDIVPKDWAGWSSEKIASYVIEQAEKGTGNVILLHDGGEDRSASVEALPVIIKELQSKGFEFTTLADLLGTTPNALMPTREGAYPIFDRITFSAAATAKSAIVVVFWVVLSIGVVRSIAIILMAVINRKYKRIETDNDPKVAVIIPAYNEQDVIAKCIESVRASTYGNLEIFVVDDGSTDNTVAEVLKFKERNEVHLISQPNQGKWSALNRAIMMVEAEYVVCIDADTQIRQDAIDHLVKHFDDPKVGAVAGKIMVGNRVNLLTRLQAYEYATSQNIDRKAFDLINGILVVPGAIGAWRVEALEEAGLYCSETLTEDTDLTIQVNRAGYKVVYEKLARGYTEAPERVGQLLKQRLRWSLGMFQSAWKHKEAIREGRSIGLVSIPDMLVFGYLFPLLAPIADLFIAIVIYSYFSGGWTGDVGSSLDPNQTKLLWAYLTLPALEFLIAFYAISTDREESNWSLLLFPLQRVFYRPLLYFSVMRAILRALTGRLATWNSLKRQGRDYQLATHNL
ncbi:glycosyl transferase and polysaccharide deacetylase fusion [Roseobacter sp. SK209-2-6]|nr:glycosyl transferase and polysaccharide deacetylase fusion [Roseobacter sp. SK209-2-6]